ncbi:hypothetical protein ES708_33101 [subsurface metagenome]
MYWRGRNKFKTMEFVPKAIANLVQAKEVTFTEVAGDGVYTGSVTLPAGSTLVDIIIHAVAEWTAETSAAMIVGDATTPNGFFNAIDLKGTDLVAGESINFAHAGGKHGADLDEAAAGAHVRRRYLTAERVISGEITTVDAAEAGGLGRTRMTVLWIAPSTETVATKV